jgi:hypothetical protein
LFFGEGLQELKRQSSPQVRGLLNVLEHWALGRTEASRFLELLEQFLVRPHHEKARE